MSRKFRQPVMAGTQWEIEHNANQTPTLFSSLKTTAKPSVRVEWMKGRPKGGRDMMPQNKRKARITLPKVGPK